MSIFADALDSGFTANGGSNITYSFSNDYSNWSDHEITQFEDALSQWENVANIPLPLPPVRLRQSLFFIIHLKHK